MGYLAATRIVFVELPCKKLSLLLQDKESRQHRILVRDKRFNSINTSTETTLNFGEDLWQKDFEAGVALLKLPVWIQHVERYVPDIKAEVWTVEARAFDQHFFICLMQYHKPSTQGIAKTPCTKLSTS